MHFTCLPAKLSSIKGKVSKWQYELQKLIQNYSEDLFTKLSKLNPISNLHCNIFFSWQKSKEFFKEKLHFLLQFLFILIWPTPDSKNLSEMTKYSKENSKTNSIWFWFRTWLLLKDTFKRIYPYKFKNLSFMWILFKNKNILTFWFIFNLKE